MKCSEGRSRPVRRMCAWAAPEQRSRVLYAQVPRHSIARYRFLLEAYDHLAIMSVVDRYRAVVKLRFLPDAEATLRGLLVSEGAVLLGSFDI